MHDHRLCFSQKKKAVLCAVESELTHGNPGGITRHMLQSLHMWCAQQYTLVMIASGRLQAAKQFLQQVLTAVYSLSKKKIPPCGFLKFFPKRLGIFNQFFTHQLYDHFYTRVQIFIQISPTLTKLCHTKRDHIAKFYISLEL